MLSEEWCFKGRRAFVSGQPLCLDGHESMKYSVTRKHKRSFEFAPSVDAGAVVRFMRQDHKNPGWFFGKTSEGIEGYFPVDWFDIQSESEKATAKRAYDAMELTVETGEVLEALDVAAGWLLVRAADGRVGWVPEKNVAVIS